MDFSTIQAAIAKLKTDFATFSADVNTKLAALSANQTNPADVQTIADITTALGQIDTSIAAADAAVNPPTQPA